MKYTDKEIYFLCEEIRTFCFMEAAGHLLKEGNSKGALHVTNLTALDKSTISTLIQGYDWKTLFKNGNWLSALKAAQNLNVLRKHKHVNESLKKIFESFPKETEGHIISEILF